MLVILASNGTIPSSVRICRFILSFAILVMTAQTLASNSLFVDFSKLRISPSSPMRERTVSPASCNQKIVLLGWGRCLHKFVPVGTNKGIFFWIYTQHKILNVELINAGFCKCIRLWLQDSMYDKITHCTALYLCSLDAWTESPCGTGLHFFIRVFK